MNDFWLFAGILLFFFVLWIYSGGPTHPISFSGPYLTPITGVGQESVGYGPSANQYLRTGSASVSGSYGGNTEVIDEARSPYAGDIFIGSSDLQTTDEDEEYISIRSNYEDDITITGWRLVSAKDGVSVRIPTGKTRGSGSNKPVRLEEGDELVITTGDRRDEDSAYESGIWQVYLDKKDDIWRSKNDTITLLDQNGKVVDQYEY